MFWEYHLQGLDRESFMSKLLEYHYSGYTSTGTLKLLLNV